MLRIGLCGPSGSGKGYVGKLIEGMGFPCLDTDALVHEMYRTDRSLINTLARRFGSEIICFDGSVDRSVLRKIVFSDRSSLNDLNKIVHCRVEDYCRQWMENCEKMGHAAAFIDAPQLFEAGMEGDFDYIIAVVSPPSVRLERIINRDGITKEAAAVRMSNQLSSEEYVAGSHFVINNGGNDNCRLQLENIFVKIGLIGN